MQNNRNLSAPFTMTTVSLPGTVGSSISGAVVGTGKASEASSKSVQELNSAQRDSLLKALNILFDESQDFHEANIPGLNLFPDGLQDILAMIREGVASSAGKLILAPFMTTSHIAQLPLDVTASIQGLLHSINNFRLFFQTKEASCLDIDKELLAQQSFLSANCKALCNHICAVSAQLKKEIDNKYEKEGSAARSHAQLANTFAATSMLGTFGTAGLVSLMFDIVGSSFREVSGLIAFSKQESTHPQVKNIFQAFSACCQSLSKRQNSRESLVALRNLEAAILDFKPASDMQSKLGLTGPSLYVFTRILTAEPFVKSLLAINSTALALTEAHQAISQEREKFYAEIKHSVKLASSLKEYNGGDHHSQNVTQFCHLFDEAIGRIDGDLQVIENNGSIANSAKTTVRSNSAFIIASSLVTGLTGIISREFSGSIDFTRNDRGSKQESKVVLQSRKEMTGADLDHLLSRICALQERLQRCQELGVSAPVALGVTQAVTSGSLIASLNVLSGMYSALRELRTMSHSPSHATELNEAERQKAAQYAQSLIDSNQKSAGTTGANSVSANLSLHQQIESIMRKVILIHRSKMNFVNPDMPRNDLDSTGKSSIAFSQGNSTGLLLGSLGVIALVSLQSGIGSEALCAALHYVTQAKRVSGGVDRTESGNNSKSNLCFASNATRLSEDSIDHSSVSKTASKATYLALESASSRSITVALCQSGALKEMLRRLVRLEEEKDRHAPGFMDSALTSDAIKPLLHANILKVLDDAEANQNPIPGLNRDMASTLASVSNASIASALCAHSSFITPILKSIVAAKKASVIPENIQNEAVSAKSELSRMITVSLNQMQAFTANFMEEIVRIDDPIQHSSLANASETSQARSMSAACAISLFCEELFEICVSRSLTLLDKQKIADHSKKSREQTQQDQHFSSNAMTEDSALDEKCRVSHVITALRLTLSHLGEALGDYATQMQSQPDLLKDNLQQHSSQKSFIKSITSGFSGCSKVMLAISAGLSQLPVSSMGSVQSLREVIHSIDRHSILEQVHSSEDSTRNCGSDSTMLTGVGTDCVVSILSTATKLLFRACVFGLDTSLSIAKILEILCLHPNPGAALSLELQEMSLPNGFSHNLHELKQNILISTTIVAASVCVASKSGDSMSTENALHTLQAAVDHQIEQIALLEDEEEDSKLGLKAFYEILIRLIDNNNQENDIFYKDLVKRFDRGGIAATSYHSEHGSLYGVLRSPKNNSLITDNHFHGSDDAAGLLKNFINKAFIGERISDSSLLDKLKHELNDLDNLSAKSRNTWEFIVNKVIEDLKNESSRQGFFNSAESRRKKVDWDKRKRNLLENSPQNSNNDELEKVDITGVINDNNRQNL